MGVMIHALREDKSSIYSMILSINEMTMLRYYNIYVVYFCDCNLGQMIGVVMEHVLKCV